MRLVLWLNRLILDLQVLGSHVGAGSCMFRLLRSSSSTLLVLGKAAEDGPGHWVPSPSWEISKKLLVLDPLGPFGERQILQREREERERFDSLIHSPNTCSGQA